MTGIQAAQVQACVIRIGRHRLPGDDRLVGTGDFQGAIIRKMQQQGEREINGDIRHIKHAMAFLGGEGFVGQPVSPAILSGISQIQQDNDIALRPQAGYNPLRGTAPAQNS